MTYKTDFYQLGDRVLIRDSRSNDTGGSENCGCGCDGSSGSCGCGCGCGSRPETCCSGPTGPTAVSYTHLDVYKRQTNWNVENFNVPSLFFRVLT